MVRDDLWSRVGPGVEGILCLSCLESRMGRPIAMDDLLLCGLTVQHPRLRAMVTDLLARWPAHGARKRRKKPRRLRPLTKRKALHVVSEEFRAIEPHATPVVDPLRVALADVARLR